MPSPEFSRSSAPVQPSLEHLASLPTHKAQALARLEQAVGQIQDSESFGRYLEVQGRFHHYSFGNVALILFQRPDATHVAGYHTWLKLHRYVRRGEKGITIFVPMRKKEDPDDPEDEGRLFFGTGTVFDISQTEGEPLPQIEVPVLTGEQGGQLYGRLKAVAKREGLSVTRGSEGLDPDSMGLYVPVRRQITVREAAPLQMTKTLAHELAHHFAGSSRSDAESESIAEAVAYVVCSHFGVDTGERSFPYVAVWSRDKAVLRQVLGTVQKVSAAIIDDVEESTTLRCEALSGKVTTGI